VWTASETVFEWWSSVNVLSNSSPLVVNIELTETDERNRCVSYWYQTPRTLRELVGTQATAEKHVQQQREGAACSG
jgi:hypothetical protein